MFCCIFQGMKTKKGHSCNYNFLHVQRGQKQDHGDRANNGHFLILLSDSQTANTETVTVHHEQTLQSFQYGFWVRAVHKNGGSGKQVCTRVAPPEDRTHSLDFGLKF